MVPSFILFTGIFYFLASARHYVSRRRDLNLVEHSAAVQQNFTVAPPFSILEIGLNYTLSTTAVNATRARNASMTITAKNRLEFLSPQTPRLQAAVAQCSAAFPCPNGSCCNSIRLPGFHLHLVTILMPYRRANMASHATTAKPPPRHASPAVMRRQFSA